jgi:thiol-disulfide isomerase/thioredoxin
MKSYPFLLAVLILGALSFTNKKNEIIITGKIKGDIPEKIEYTNPVNGVCDWSFKESVGPDKLGNFKIRISLNETVFVKIRILGKAAVTLVVEPNEKYEVNFDLSKTSKEGNFEIISTNKKGQNKWNSLPKIGHIQSTAIFFMKDSIAATIREKISKLRYHELEDFEILFKNGEISKEFFNLIKIDRTTYYAAVQGTVGYLKFNEDMREKNGAFSDEIKKLWKSTFQEYPITEKTLLSPWFFSYADNFIKFNLFTDPNFSQEDFKEKNKSGLINTYIINESKKHLNSVQLEHFEASYIYFECFQEKFEKEFIDLFKKFKLDYPNSEYTKYLEPMVNPIIEYHQRAVNPFNKETTFIENYETLNSLKEATASFRGKKLYIDVWATWCGPCKKEFIHKEELKKLLDSNETKILYISIDDEQRDKQWKEMIKFYNLEGCHIRTNKNLKADLIKIFNNNGSISIPWYILIDEQGNIVNPYAKAPSHLEELAKELNNISQK